LKRIEETSNIVVTEVTWQQQHEALSAIRHQVFIEEQQVPAELEWDGKDKECLHILAQDFSKDNPIGTGRLVSDGQIGRMAILKDYRRQGIGQQILQLLIKLAAQGGHTSVYLHAQTSAIAFYEKAQFKTSGEVFMDAGIEHINMTLQLS